MVLVCSSQSPFYYMVRYYSPPKIKFFFFYGIMQYVDFHKYKLIYFVSCVRMCYQKVTQAGRSVIRKSFKAVTQTVLKGLLKRRWSVTREHIITILKNSLQARYELLAVYIKTNSFVGTTEMETASISKIIYTPNVAIFCLSSSRHRACMNEYLVKIQLNASLIKYIPAIFNQDSREWSS